MQLWNHVGHDIIVFSVMRSQVSFVFITPLMCSFWVSPLVTPIRPGNYGKFKNSQRKTPKVQVFFFLRAKQKTNKKQNPIATIQLYLQQRGGGEHDVSCKFCCTMDEPSHQIFFFFFLVFTWSQHNFRNIGDNNAALLDNGNIIFSKYICCMVQVLPLWHVIDWKQPGQRRM